MSDNERQERHEYNPTIQRDFMLSMLGRQLGEGIARRVFLMDLRDDLVVKIEDGARSFQNVLEHEAWERVKGTEFGKWFAPVEWISACGMVMLMKRTMPAQPKQLPARLPVFLTDTKRTNYGMLNGKFVCHDYGTNILMERGMSKAMHKVDWWGEQ
jgi:hypothetical protein